MARCLNAFSRMATKYLTTWGPQGILKINSNRIYHCSKYISLVKNYHVYLLGSLVVIFTKIKREN